ncbi:MAG: DUF5683 domain-containing protein [Gemmatimonadota bacterium]
MRGPSIFRILAALGAFPILAGPSQPALGQLPDSLLVPPVAQEAGTPSVALTPEGTSPRGAFIRSALIPGWGHTKVKAYVRGAFYFTAETATALMVYKTQTRITGTRKQLDMREAVVTARLGTDPPPGPSAIESALAQDPVVEDLRLLEESRIGQREDWIALGLFLMLIGGVDAYVSAHLADFPAAVVIGPSPATGVEIGLSLPIGLF